MALAEFQRAHVRPTPGRALVVGSKVYNDKLDRRTLYPDPFGVDMLDGPGVDLVHNLERPLPAGIGLFSHVDCCSVLEHVRNPFKFARSVEQAMKPGASILLVVPWVWRIHAYPNDYWRFTPSAIRMLFANIEWKKPLYLVHDKITRVVPKHTDEKSRRFFARAELAMTGIRQCNSAS